MCWVECVVEDGASVRGAVFTTGVCKVAGTVKTTRKVNFEINPIDPKKKKKKKIDHKHTPHYLGTMLTGLQTLLRDEQVLSPQLNGGFTIADMLDALPCSSSKATPTPTPVPGIGSSKPVPKPHVKRVRINPPSPPALPKPSAPVKADCAPVALDRRPPPSEAPTVSCSAPKHPS
jgi:hypothetical protein